MFIPSFSPLASRTSMAALAVAGLALGMPNKAHALLQLSADVSGTLFNCAANQACNTSGSLSEIALGSTTVPIVLNGVSILGSVTTAGPNILSSSSLSVVNNSGAARTITVAFSDTGFSGPFPLNSFSNSGSGTFLANLGGTMTMGWYDDPTNTQGANTPTDTPGTLLDTFTTTATTANSFSFAHNNSGSVADSGPYSMTETFTFTLAPGASLLSRGETLTKSPEPATLGVLGIGLLGLGIACLRRKTKA